MHIKFATEIFADLLHSRNSRKLLVANILRYTVYAVKRITFVKHPCMVLLQCATITSCGNFAVLGMNTGHVEVFNMQSGLHRGVLGGEGEECWEVRGEECWEVRGEECWEARGEECWEARGEECWEVRVRSAGR